MAAWFVTDHHFRHGATLRPDHCNRQFGSTDEMDEFILNAHNQIVDDNDDVYLLGDFVFGEGKQSAAHSLLSRMKGRKHWILGNHDNRRAAGSLKQAGLVSTVEDYLEISIHKQRIVLCHYPILSWNGIRKNTWHLHGHCHGQLGWNAYQRILDVGVDTAWGSHQRYYPYSFLEIADLMRQKIYHEPVGTF